jgi:predicted CxxxxCH...CXXCH cytochrome family protein
VTTRALLALLPLLLAGCSESRNQPAPAGAHPAGWATVGPDGGVATDDPDFHGTWLKTNGFPLSRCQQCHGDDFSGGAVGLSCAQGGCHTQPNGPIACTTCHGSKGTPRPDQGAHWAHDRFCDTCHQVPAQSVADVERHASGDESTLIRFGGLALQGAAAATPPAWDSTAQKCTNTYCHGATSPVWTTTTQIGCDGCHQAPPANHARWSRVATGTSSCTTCHPGPTSPTHVDGQVDVTVTSCTACHGSNGHANPPLSLDGSTDPTTRGVGAHERHLDGTIPDRSTDPFPCGTCHLVPASVLQPGHFDQPQAQVVFPWGPRFGASDAYDPSSGTCNVWCHFNKTPSVASGPGRDPTWTDASGASHQCNACHDFPPTTCRDGTTHPTLPPNPTVAVCQLCHIFSRSTHVNGVVDFRP